MVRSAHHANGFLHPTLLHADGSPARGGAHDDGASGAIAGVMIGRAAYDRPWESLSAADTQVCTRGAGGNYATELLDPRGPTQR
jgi:tRNA-dihydrouridine synthase